MKIYYSYNKKEREGFVTKHPEEILLEEEGSVEEISGEDVLEKIPNLPLFFKECYRLLRPGGTAVFTSAYYNSYQAWADPRNIRGISQCSLNFASKIWREQNKCEDLADCNFDVAINFAVDRRASERSDVAKEFWLSFYSNVVQSVLFTLTKV